LLGNSAAKTTALDCAGRPAGGVDAGSATATNAIAIVMASHRSLLNGDGIYTAYCPLATRKTARPCQSFLLSTSTTKPDPDGPGFVVETGGMGNRQSCSFGRKMI
jgi:hypothetical protein